MALEQAMEPLERERRLVVAVASALLVLLGVVVLVGWALHNDALMMVQPGRVSMKANTAVGFILAGLALGGTLTGGYRRRWWTLGLGLLTLVWGGMVVAEYALHIDLGLDELLFHDPLQNPWPGRMARITAVNFCIAGLCLALIGRAGRLRWVRQVLEALVLGTALASIVGWIYGVPLLYGAVGVAGYTSMALHTGAGFLVLGVGLLSADADNWVMQAMLPRLPGGWIARRSLPFIVVVPIVLGWAYLRPALDFGGAQFGMALLAATVVAVGSAGMVVAALMLNGFERSRALTAELLRVGVSHVERSERELRLVTDHLPTLISYIDTEGRFLRVNRTYESWMGRPAGEIVGRTVEQLLGTPYWTSTEAARARAAAGETVTFESVYPTVRGERHVQVTYAPDFAADGGLRGFACMVLDVEERRRAQAALLQSEKLAVVGRLASSIAHEINNPLEAVTNLLYLAEQDLTELKLPVAEYVAQAQTELGRVTHIVVQTLRFHRQSTYAEEAQVAELAEQVLVLHRSRLTGARIAVEPRYRDFAPLLCKEGEIRQVLANLIGNAVDAMPGGGRLLVRTATLGGKTVVTVADTGSGIAESARGTLFEPFHTTKGERGSGLGLWVSKEIVERHGGTLRVRSSRRVGASGTVFRMVLPGG